ncbi:DNA/RNA nuclease SfsA [Intestinimonas timonensis]|uniref:DNA/RNA nuclease SfsA n=1 Tax=Intestinimonas timonensis TaxID=1689270 RepID=UPI001031ADDD|nr:DNA/RNA nuclease SfsA [Intestinimonas timonensis]
MQYQTVKKAVFLRRPNRFIAQVALEGAEETVHVKNTGRCRELLVPGATVYLVEGKNPSRKTRYDLIAVEKGERLINMDAQAPNQVFGEWAASGGFRPGLTLLRPETTWGNSRFDFYWESSENDRKGFVEVKGVTLEEDGAVYFPDAPTERGVKHVEELIACRAAGYEAALFLVVQMERVAFWSPNDRTHPAFGEAVRRAAAAGVEILCRDCRVTPDSLTMGEPVEVRL